MADVMCLAYQLAERNGTKSQSCKRNEKTGKKWLKIPYVVIKKFQSQSLKVFTLKSEGFHS
jgi:hypothetical protein